MDSINAALRHSLISVAGKRSPSYGGSQSFSSSTVIKGCGCGIVAACELFVYLHRFARGCSCDMFSQFPAEEALSLEAYDSLLNKFRLYFPLIPRFGINGLMLTLGINAFFTKYSYPYKASWCLSASKLWSRVEYMLERDIPVIIGVGPNLPLFWKKHKTGLYSKISDSYRKTNSVNAHFMIATAIDDEWLTVSSWGRKYHIRRCEFEDYSTNHSSSAVCNIVYIERK